VAACVAANLVGAMRGWDLFNLAFSFQAAYAAPIIMMSQNRQSYKDRLEAEIDHDVNTRAEAEVGLILRRLDGIDAHLSRMGYDMTNGHVG